VLQSIGHAPDSWSALRFWGKTGLVLAFTILLRTTGPVLAEEEPQAESGQSLPSQKSARVPVDYDDGFVPLTKLAPRAKIALRPNERLPNLDGDKTFASFGTLGVTPDWNAGPPPVPMYWPAYHPLYFEDPNLERIGLSCGYFLQPLVSGAHFFGSVAFLPVKIPYAPPCSYVFPPGEYPPGAHFPHCKSFLGQRPDLPGRFGCSSLLHTR
jgi:hypothetical protein